MRRIAVFIVAVCVWCSGVATALSDEEARQKAEALNAKVQQQLEQKIDVAFEKTKLEAAIDELRRKTKLNYVVHWAALELAGVERNTPVNLQLKQVAASVVLKDVLRQVNLDETNPVTFHVVDGVIHVSTAYDLRGKPELRVYDIRDILTPIRHFPGPTLDNDIFSAQPSVEGEDAVVFGLIKTPEDDPWSRKQIVEAVIELIQLSVGEPDDWRDIGGGDSSLRELNGQLIVRTTAANHRGLRLLLEELRDSRAQQVGVAMRLIRTTPQAWRTLMGDEHTAQVLGAKQAATLLARIDDGEIEGVTILASASQLSFNGQITHVAAGRETTTVDKGRFVNPRLTAAAVTYRGTVSRETRNVLLSVDARATITNKPAAVGAEGDDGVAEQVDSDVLQFATTVDVKAGGCVVLGGAVKGESEAAAPVLLIMCPTALDSRATDKKASPTPGGEQ